jgi:acyl-CoA reductase-like NAD-dependent aldehyde dehydrogenase
MPFRLRFLHEIATAPTKRTAEAVIDAAREELAAMDPDAKAELLCQVADLIAELPGEDD